MAYKPNQGGGAAEKGLFSTVKYIYLYCHSGYNDEWYHWRSSFCPGHAQQTVDKVWTTSSRSASSTCLPPFVHHSDLDHDLSTDNIWHTLLDLLSTPLQPWAPKNFEKSFDSTKWRKISRTVLKACYLILTFWNAQQFFMVLLMIIIWKNMRHTRLCTLPMNTGWLSMQCMRAP